MERSGLPQSVIVVVGLAMLLNYVDRGSLATAGPVLQDELSLSSSQVGLLLSAFFWMYAPAQILAGWLVHRFDVRVVLPAGILLWAVATGLTGFATGFASILVLRLLLGLGESVTFPSAQLIVARHAAEHERGRANGIIGAGQGVGPMIGTLLGGLTMAYFGWRVMFIGLGLVTVLWVWPWFTSTRSFAMHRAEDQGEPSISYLEILARREFWGVGLGQFCLNYAFYFIITWLPAFLVKAGGFTVQEMAYIGAAIYGIYATATTLAGVASDRWIRGGGSPTKVRKAFMLASCMGGAVTIALCAYVEPRSAAWLLGVAGFFFGFTTAMLYSIGPILAGSRAAGRWAGAQNLCGQLAGVLAPWLTGEIIDRTGGYSLAFAISAATLLLAMVAFGVIIRRIEPVAWPEQAITVERVA